MASIREIKHRIGSVTSTRKITNAMKMVAAAKLHKAQSQEMKLYPYAQKLAEMVENMLPTLDAGLLKTYAAKRQGGKLLLVVIAADRGLCGSFNANVFRKALACIPIPLSLDYIDVLPIGKKAHAYFQQQNFKTLTHYVNLWQGIDYEQVSQVATFIRQAFETGVYGKVQLIYNTFKNAATQITTVAPFLPMHLPEKKSDAENTDYIYEPSTKAIIQTLIPQAINMQLYKALLDSNAAEQGARMTAMSQSTDNADELLKTLCLTYNRTRQAAITREITEIVAGSA